jgi:hypothetical protein
MQKLHSQTCPLNESGEKYQNLKGFFFFFFFFFLKQDLKVFQPQVKLSLFDLIVSYRKKLVCCHILAHGNCVKLGWARG